MSSLGAVARKSTLPPPPAFDVGSIVMLRMRGHSRTGGPDYFSPAVVLNQHSPNGEIEVLIWDSSAGTHYQSAYPVRDLSTRGAGDERELYVERENVSQTLFSPLAFAKMAEAIDELQGANIALQTQLLEISGQIADLLKDVTVVRPPVHPPAPAPATHKQTK